MFSHLQDHRDEIRDKFEDRFVVGVDSVFPVVVDSVIVLESVAMLVHQEDAWNVSYSKRIVVAVVGEFLSIQFFEIPLLCIYLLK